MLGARAARVRPTSEPKKSAVANSRVRVHARERSTAFSPLGVKMPALIVNFDEVLFRTGGASPRPDAIRLIKRPVGKLRSPRNSLKILFGNVWHRSYRIWRHPPWWPDASTRSKKHQTRSILQPENCAKCRNKYSYSNAARRVFYELTMPSMPM